MGGQPYRPCILCQTGFIFIYFFYKYIIFFYLGTKTVLYNAKVTHSRTGGRISHGCTFVAIRIGPQLSVLHP